MRREIEILVCCAFVLLMRFNAIRSGTLSWPDHAVFYSFFGVFSLLLIGLATIMTIAKRDLWFRIGLYPLSFFIGFALLINAYGYGWAAFWYFLPVGVQVYSVATLWIFILNWAMPPFIWSRSTIWQSTRRTIEILPCYVFFYLMWESSTAPHGSSMYGEWGFLYCSLSVLLIVFATIMTIIKRDLWFRILLYPLTLFIGSDLIFDIRANIWVPFALFAAGWIYLLNGAFPLLWSKLTSRLKT